MIDTDGTIAKQDTKYRYLFWQCDQSIYYVLEDCYVCLLCQTSLQYYYYISQKCYNIVIIKQHQGGYTLQKSRQSEYEQNVSDFWGEQIVIQVILL